MTEADRDRMRDEGTVWLMERTSWRSPADHLVDCRWCGMPFWSRRGAVYCSASHRVAACDKRTKENVA